MVKVITALGVSCFTIKIVFTLQSCPYNNFISNCPFCTIYFCLQVLQYALQSHVPPINGNSTLFTPSYKLSVPMYRLLSHQFLLMLYFLLEQVFHIPSSISLIPVNTAVFIVVSAIILLPFLYFILKFPCNTTNQNQLQQALT